MTTIARLVPQLNNDLGDVADSARRSLVRVEVGRQGTGSGVVIGSTGLIVTNAHVVSGRSGRGKGSNLRVTLNNGETYSAQLLAKDSDHDVAALKIETDGLIPIELGDSQTLRPGRPLAGSSSVPAATCPSGQAPETIGSRWG